MQSNAGVAPYEALKGGPNLLEHDLPRLLVDIDLAWLKFERGGTFRGAEHLDIAQVKMHQFAGTQGAIDMRHLIGR